MPTTLVLHSATPEGRQAFGRWLAQPSTPPQFESEALLRVLFAEHGTKKELLATLRSLQEQMDALGFQGAALIAEHVNGGPFPQRLHLIALATRFSPTTSPWFKNGRHGRRRRWRPGRTTGHYPR